MPTLDETLVDFFKTTSKDVSDKNKILVTDDVKFRKVAFDMVKVYGDHYDGLWKVESSGDDQYLVRASIPQSSERGSGDWTAIGDYEGSNVTLSYKQVPICRFASDEFGFSSDDIMTFKSALLGRMTSDSDFVREVISSQPSAKIEALSSVFPEVKSFIK